MEFLKQPVEDELDEEEVSKQDHEYRVQMLHTYRKGQYELMQGLATSVRAKLGMLPPRRYFGLFGPRKPWSQHGVRSGGAAEAAGKE